MVEKADIKEALNLNNNCKYITPYTLGLVMSSPTNCPIRIGDLLISTISRNPSEDYVSTEWEYFGQGRCLVGVDTSQSEFDSLLKTGGSKLMQAHTHGIPLPNIAYYSGGGGQIHFPSAIGGGGDFWSGGTSSTGGGNAENLQPYICVYMWKRIK